MILEADCGAVAAHPYNPSGDTHGAQVMFFAEYNGPHESRIREGVQLVFHSHADARAFANDLLFELDQYAARVEYGRLAANA